MLKNSRQINFLLLIMAITATAMFVTSCVTIPKEAVHLSEELGKMIHSAEQSHIAIIDEYVDERRKIVDQFLNDKWFPEFMKEFSKDSKIEKLLAEEKDPGKRSAIISEFTEDAANKLQERRASLLDALDNLRRLLHDRIGQHYSDMRITNQTLTAHLRAASKVSTTRDELLKQLKIPIHEIVPFKKIDGVADKLLNYKGKVEDVQKIVDEAQSILKEE